MKSHQWSLAVAAVLTCFGMAHAQNSAPSSHFVFDDNFDGDIIINEVRVPKSGEAMYTYYEALGWRGRGAGYAGIQVHPRAHNFIFSIWDHKEHTAPIKAVYHGPGTETQGFGGEGTGLKSWNLKLGWKTDVWYTLAARLSIGQRAACERRDDRCVVAESVGYAVLPSPQVYRHIGP